MNFAAKTLQKSAMDGFKRLRNFRLARKLFIEAYVGQYYNRDHGVLGAQPLNMAFTAIRALVPNLISRNPHNIVESDYLMYRQYGELLALALNFIAKKKKLPKILERGLVDAIFTIGIYKVGLMTSDSLAYFSGEGVDPGTLYFDTVDFDNFTFDPNARQMEKAAFVGEIIRVERDELLASGMYNNAIVERLPSTDSTGVHDRGKVKDLSMNNVNKPVTDGLHDSIDLLELWLPGLNVIVTLPYKSSIGNTFLREETFYGPEEGPYTYLSLTPPVPNNPIPVSMAGVWHDLHTIGNRLAKKALDQAEAQKDILAYRGDSADDAQEIVSARNLEVVRVENPDGVQMFSVGGQNPQNEQMVAQILSWFDQFSGNTSMLAGTNIDTNVATVANILQQGAATGISYMKTQFKTATEEVLRKAAWYLHTDPLIQLPLVRRKTIPAVYDITPTEVRMIEPSRTEETQVFLIPEARRGDFLDFAFSIEEDSMAPINWQFRLQQLDTLLIKILPSAAQAAQIAAAMGTPFSLQKLITRVAKMMNITWIDEIFQMPELVAQMAAVAQAGPQADASKGIASPGAMKQNGGPATAKPTPSQSTQNRQSAQSGANQSQSKLPVREK